MKRFLKILSLLLVGALWACEPKKDPAPNQIDQVEQYALSPRVTSIGIGQVATFTASFTAKNGTRSAVTPSLIVLDTAKAVSLGNGQIRAKAAGTVSIISQYRTINDTVRLQIIADSSSLASLVLTPDTVELLKNETVALRLTGKDLRGNTIAVGPTTVSYHLSNPLAGRLDGSTFTALNWGTTLAYAKVGNVTSAPIELAVIRKGSFRGIEGHSGRGAVVVKMKNNQVVIRYETDFLCQYVPDARVYLSNTPEGGSRIAQGGIELALLRSFNGRQSYIAPSNVQIGDYAHAVVYCRQFSQGVLTAPIQ